VNSGALSAPPRQLIVYRFRERAEFEGQLVGALQRIEVGAAVRVLDGLFLGRDPETGELVAASLGAAASSSMVASLVGFRLDRAQRKQTTERVLASPDSEQIRRLADALTPGEALFALLLEHAWAAALSEAVDRVGGQVVGRSEFVEAGSIAELLPRIRGEVEAGA
jgi:hypothetical protein